MKIRDEQTPIAQVVGYMLKVIKSGNNIKAYKEAFNAIKHGDYDCFLRLINEPMQGFIVQWKEGEMKTEGFAQAKGDSDIALLYVIEPSIIQFGKTCFTAYGKLVDADIPDLIFCRCAAYEISMRVQLNKEAQNRKLRYNNLTLAEAIAELGKLNEITDTELDLLHQGRRFINLIKHPGKSPKWAEGMAAFEAAWTVREKYQLQIY